MDIMGESLISSHSDSSEGGLTLPPTDTANLAVLTHFLLGIGCILPWNTFTTAADYFEYLYPDSHISRVFVVIYQFSFFITLSLLLRFGLRISSRIRINVGLVLLLLPILAVPIVNALIIREEGDRNNPFARILTLILIGFAAVGTGVMEGSVTGAAGELPEGYMRAVVSGTGACGVLVAFLRITTKASLPQTPEGLRMSSNVYFIFTAGILILCMISYNWIHKLPIMIHYKSMKDALIRANAEAKTLTAHANQETDGSSTLLVKAPEHENISSRSDDSGLVGTFLSLKWYAGSVVLTFAITFSIFPGFLAEDVHSAFLKDWYPVLLITVYYCSDLLGKLSTSLYIPKRLCTVVVITIARFLFIPLFALFLFGPEALKTEACVFLATCLLGFTSGFLASTNFVLTPKLVSFAQSESVGMMIDLALGVGVVMGSVLSWLWTI